ncbi:MAG: hypothetical protein U1C33_05560 [Candidatus Cloacimonadaceae bacterium]|nr:hypothetical protein [Candidatus Cloacimonadaceae bacterium]
MRLSGILSKPPNDQFMQIEGFLDGKKLQPGHQREIAVGLICLPFFCKTCGDYQIFLSDEKLFCIGVNECTISIDSVVTCPQCRVSSVPTWFLITCDKEIFSGFPNVKLLKHSYKLSDEVSLSEDRYLGFKEMLDKAQLAYAENLGAGSVVYLRKILEIITFSTAEVAGIETRNQNNRRKPFKSVLEEVDRVQRIIPRKFSENGYRLFKELSNVIHGDSEELEALQKYPPLRRLVIGVIDNVKNNQEMNEAISALGWNGVGEPR